MDNKNRVTSVRLQIYASQALFTQNMVLQYHRGTDRLRIWRWSVRFFVIWFGKDSRWRLTGIATLNSRPTTSNGCRLHPSEFLDHRITHRIMGPCCLCPLEDSYAPDFLEAAIGVKTSGGPYSGEYVACCAKNKCRYLGMQMHFCAFEIG